MSASDYIWPSHTNIRGKTLTRVADYYVLEQVRVRHSFVDFRPTTGKL